MTNSYAAFSNRSALSLSSIISSKYFELLHTTKHSSRELSIFLNTNRVTGSAFGGSLSFNVPELLRIHNCRSLIGAGSFCRSNRRKNCLLGGSDRARVTSGAEADDRHGPMLNARFPYPESWDGGSVVGAHLITDGRDDVYNYLLLF